MAGKIKTRTVTFDGEDFTVVPVFNKKSKKRGDDLLREVAEIIRQEPLRINMGIPQIRVDDDPATLTYETQDGDERNILDEAPPCGTVGCIAGWADALVLSGTPLEEDDRTWNRVSQRAASHLRLNEHPDFDADDLFFVANWPYEFKIRYNEAEENKDYVERANVTADRILYFIETRE
jgi:hypothetical protein